MRAPTSSAHNIYSKSCSDLISKNRNVSVHNCAFAAINHIALNCRKAAAQEAFFAKHFGFQRSRTFNAGKPNEYIMLKLGSVRLELFRTASAKTEHQKGGEQRIGFKHLALGAEG